MTGLTLSTRKELRKEEINPIRIPFRSNSYEPLTIHSPLLEWEHLNLSQSILQQHP